MNRVNNINDFWNIEHVPWVDQSLYSPKLKVKDGLNMILLLFSSLNRKYLRFCLGKHLWSVKIFWAEIYRGQLFFRAESSLIQLNCCSLRNCVINVILLACFTYIDILLNLFWHTDRNFCFYAEVNFWDFVRNNSSIEWD
jgi:hypothetical protein